ncbi:hypothetical protein D3C81_1745920 [compost metagenome]
MEQQVEIPRRHGRAGRADAVQLQAPVTVFPGKQAQFRGGIDQLDELHMVLYRFAQAGAGIQGQIEAIEVGRLVIADRAQAEIRVAGHLDTAQP